MKVFNNLKEMKPYYNEEINMYLFNDDVKFICDIVVDSGIDACDIDARDINAWNINAWDIKSRNINAWDIEVGNINAYNIKAWNINTCDINANNINTLDITAWDINARNIKANNISFYAVCFARETFVCNSIKGRRENSKYFCLDSEVVIKSQKS